MAREVGYWVRLLTKGLPPRNEAVVQAIVDAMLGTQEAEGAASWRRITLGITHVKPPGEDASGIQGPSLDERIKAASGGNPYRAKMRTGASRRGM